MKFDIYKFLKLEDRSRRIYVRRYPQIYIYGDICINMETNESITLIEPTEDSPLLKQLLPNDEDLGFFLILDSGKNRQAIFVEGKDTRGKYSYGIHTFNAEGYKIGSYFYSGDYHIREYFIDEGKFLSKVFDKDGKLLSEAFNKISYAELH